ncbi:MAG: protein kinase [Victivallaceae bacterium]|nr:protein kinase [Victivallaceae bacterium]
MRFQCPECKGIIDYEGQDSSVDVKCGHCGRTVNVPDSQTAPGCLIDDFLLIRYIAAGGMGEVFLARQMSLDRDVALKILRPKFADDTEFIRLFIQEARAAAKLNHPNVVQAYAVGESDGLFYFAMEFIDGKTMKEVLAEEKGGKIEPLRAARIIRDIADALHFAWTEYKIVHHDIKPDNIMLNSSGRAKLADLGLAQVGTDNGENDDEEVLGTPQYISPEQLTGAPTDVRSDIYSLGATFYQFVTGKFPFEGDSPEEIGRKHLDAPLVAPMKVDKSVPREVSDIIVKMMAKSPGDRYQSGRALTEALDKYIAHVEGTTRGIKLAMPTVNVNKVNTGSLPSPGTTLTGSLPVSAPKLTVAVSRIKEPEKVVAPLPSSGAETPENTGAKDKSETRAAQKAAKSRGKSRGKLWLAVGAVFVLLLVGGGAFVFLTPQGKSLFASLTGKISGKNAASGGRMENSAAPKTAARSESKAQAPTQSPAQKRRTRYLAGAAALKSFLANNPNAEEELLRRVDAFLEDDQYGHPGNQEELTAMLPVLETYSRVDERLRIEPVREAGRRQRQEMVAQRQRAMEAAAQQRREMEARRQAEEMRRRLEAERRNEEAQRRREAEEQRKLAAMGRLREYRKQVAEQKEKIDTAFRAFLRGENEEESTVKVMNAALAFADQRSDGMTGYEIEEAKQFAGLVRQFLPEIAYCEKIRSFLNDPAAVSSSSFEVRPGELIRVVSCRPEGFQVVSKLNGKSGVIPYSNRAFLERFFRTVARRAKLEHFPFYFSLMLGRRGAPELRSFPNNFWRAHLNEFL